jgi:hypothetical protein
VWDVAHANSGHHELKHVGRFQPISFCEFLARLGSHAKIGFSEGGIDSRRKQQEWTVAFGMGVSGTGIAGE